MHHLVEYAKRTGLDAEQLKTAANHQRFPAVKKRSTEMDRELWFIDPSDSQLIAYAHMLRAKHAYEHLKTE